MAYAASTGISTSTIIQDEWMRVSRKRAPYTRRVSTGAAAMSSRSRARKNDESAVMMFESSRMGRNASSTVASSLTASTSPSPGVRLKYASTRCITEKRTAQKMKPMAPRRRARARLPLSAARRLAVRHFGA
ncbi:MAG: hypothetical protein A2W29_01565 [Gemmatimonadetes bacterium RBG_16_66_8]|nr:MAG: hypothetical protein A2W29_01565 [Gemmatimonadetes bacterium RBG_16_66_8]